MNPFDLQKSLNGMVCLVDTREQDTPRLRARLAQMGCEYRREALKFGDYSAEFPLPDGNILSLKDKVSIERKMDLGELCNCFGHDRSRFTREFERAKESGAKLYLIIEGADWDKAYNGKYRSKMHPKSLVSSMFAWLARYDCQLIMCQPNMSGKIIREILYREGKERLESYEIH